MAVTATEPQQETTMKKILVLLAVAFALATSAVAVMTIQPQSAQALHQVPMLSPR
jgi:hypothetical protein